MLWQLLEKWDSWVKITGSIKMYIFLDVGNFYHQKGMETGKGTKMCSPKESGKIVEWSYIVNAECPLQSSSRICKLEKCKTRIWSATWRTRIIDGKVKRRNGKVSKFES